MNLLEAIYNFHNYNELFLQETFAPSSNRANQMGRALEVFVQDMFANTLRDNERSKLSKYENVFSYTGNSNSPPDFILKGSDAFEVKKARKNEL